MIQEFKTPEEANSVPDPKHVWIDGNRTVVFTGVDIPIPPPVVERTYMESEVIGLLKNAGKSDSEAKAMLEKSVDAAK